jgi:2-polyprenyl-3-methyl-5-hydroxy-6-metoxy-1,4-benzoquinol methylase
MFAVWNVNIHYDGLLERLVPLDAHSVLDVGCGDGLLSARLARRVPCVVGLDTAAPVVERFVSGNYARMPGLRSGR